MKLEKNFGKNLLETCVKTAEAMKELGKLLAQLNVKEKLDRSKFHS